MKTAPETEAAKYRPRAKAGMRATAREHRVMGRAGTRLRKLHLGGMLRPHEPPPWDAVCDARLRLPRPRQNGLSSASPGIDLARLGSALTNCHNCFLR